MRNCYRSDQVLASRYLLALTVVRVSAAVGISVIALISVVFQSGATDAAEPPLRMNVWRA